MEYCEQSITYHEEMARHARALKDEVCALPVQLSEEDKWWERTPEEDQVPPSAAATAN
jgi:hypothetical protein